MKAENRFSGFARFRFFIPLIFIVAGFPVFAAGDTGDTGRAAGWPVYGGDAGGQRHVLAEQITPRNVHRLKPAWHYRTGDMDRYPAERMRESAFEATPVLAADSLFFCTPFNEVVAVDPGTGAEKWRYDPRVRLDGRPANQFTCRGVAYWEGRKKEGDTKNREACAARIFTNTVDSRLIALDAYTGRPCSSFGERGEVHIDPGMALLWPGEFQMTSAPVLVGDTVIIGSAIADNQRRVAPGGVVRAFEAGTGREIWRFDPLLREGEIPKGGQGQQGVPAVTGHANVWAPMSVDEKRGWVFLPTSSPGPDHFGGLRPGDNRYANSVVALEAGTGEVVWHFQTVHHDVWDYDVPAQPSLVTLEREGKPLDVVIQVTKTGFMFVLDRENGQPVFGVEERPVPQGGVAGEFLSPTQPHPLAPPPFAAQTLKPDDAYGLVFFDRLACKARLKSLRHDGLYTPPGTGGTLLYPFTGGGANWGGISFDPGRQIAIVNSSALPMFLKLHPRPAGGAEETARDTYEGEYGPQSGTPYAMSRGIIFSPLGLPCSPPPWGKLTAIDLRQGTIKWDVPLGALDVISGLPLPLEWGVPNLGGSFTTRSGLVFIAASLDNRIRAFDTETGETLWRHALPASGTATPMSYEWQGRQYVVIAAGGHGRSQMPLADSLIAFTLDGASPE